MSRNPLRPTALAGVRARAQTWPPLTRSTTRPTLTLPLNERSTTDRTEKATLVAVNSVAFRSSGQNLTGWGKIVEMLSRISEPALLGPAALAIRGRVKRRQRDE
jgi:hypothetical protein